MSNPQVPESISTASLQKFIPNAQKPNLLPLTDLSRKERLDLLSQAVRNIYNAFGENAVAYKDLAAICVDLLLKHHERYTKYAFEQYGHDCSSAWIRDTRDLENALLLIRQIDMGSEDIVYTDNT